MDGTFRFRSLNDSSWVLGFNSKGQPVSGKSFRNPITGALHRKPECFRFTKTSHTLNYRSNAYNIADHNRRMGGRSSHKIPAPQRASPFQQTSSAMTVVSVRPTLLQAMQQQTSHISRHAKKSHRRRHRHLKRSRSADRWVCFKTFTISLSLNFSSSLFSLKSSFYWQRQPFPSCTPAGRGYHPHFSYSINTSLARTVLPPL